MNVLGGELDGKKATILTVYSHVVQRHLAQAVPAFSSGCNCSQLPLISWLGWTKENGARQGKIVGEGMRTL